MQAVKTAALESNINVTPLVDVCLVLLIIFMVVTPLLVTGVPLQLPKTGTGEHLGDATRLLQVSVKDDGTVYLGAIAVRREQIATELATLHGRTPDRPVVVRGDRRVLYGEVVFVLDACRAAGFRDVGLAGQQSDRSASTANR